MGHVYTNGGEVRSRVSARYRRNETKLVQMPAGPQYIWGIQREERDIVTALGFTHVNSNVRPPTRKRPARVRGKRIVAARRTKRQRTPQYVPPVKIQRNKTLYIIGGEIQTVGYTRRRMDGEEEAHATAREQKGREDNGKRTNHGRRAKPNGGINCNATQTEKAEKEQQKKNAGRDTNWEIGK